MKKFFFTILLSISLCFGTTVLGVDASTLNDLSPTNTIYTSQQVDKIADDISHEMSLDYALKTNVLSGASDEDEGIWTCTQSDVIYEFPLHVNNSKFTINPGYIGLLGYDGGEIRANSSGFFEGVKGFYNQIGENAQCYNLPSNAPGIYVLATTNDIPDVSGYVPWDTDRNGNKTMITIGTRNSTTAGYGPNSVSIGAGNYTSGQYSLSVGSGNQSVGFGAVAFGNYCQSVGNYAFAAGNTTTAKGMYSTTLGTISEVKNGHNYAFAWNGIYGVNPDHNFKWYRSHGEGTFNINPKPVAPSTDPASGFFIGESNLVQIVNALVDQRIVYAVENGIIVNGTNYVLITENTLTNVLQNYHGQGF